MTRKPPTSINGGSSQYCNEASECVKQGANEIDMVINIGDLKDRDYIAVEDDIRAVVEASKPAIVKVIIEICLLNEEEKVLACKLSVSAGAEFVKTSTGFSTGGATVEDIKLMNRAVKGAAKVKASGGVRSYEQAMELIEAGTDSIGAGDGKVLDRSYIEVEKGENTY